MTSQVMMKRMKKLAFSKFSQSIVWTTKTNENAHFCETFSKTRILTRGVLARRELFCMGKVLSVLGRFPFSQLFYLTG